MLKKRMTTHLSYSFLTALHATGKELHNQKLATVKRQQKILNTVQLKSMHLS